MSNISSPRKKIILSFFQNLDLSEIESELYFYILLYGPKTFSEIREYFNYSYSQVRDNLKKLVNAGFMGINNKKPVSYQAYDFRVVLNEVIEKKINKYNDIMDKLDEEIRIFHSDYGVCDRTITTYYYDNLVLGINRMFEIIKNAKFEIIIGSMPIDLMYHLQKGLKEAVLRGVKVICYYSELDFEEEVKYKEKIMQILSSCRAEIIQTKEKICRVVNYNENLVNEGWLLVDDTYFSNYCFNNQELLLMNGFREPGVVLAVKKMLYNKTMVKGKILTDYPDNVIKVKRAIRANKGISKNKLSQLTGISGSKLKRIITILERDNSVIKSKKGSGRGRPSYLYSVLN